MTNLGSFTGNFANYDGRKVEGTYYGQPFTGILKDSRLDWSTRDRMFYVNLDAPVLSLGREISTICVRPSHDGCSIYAI